MAANAANREHHDSDCGGKIFPDPALTAVDSGDLGFDENDAEGNRKFIRGAVSTILQKKEVIPVVLGGDNSIPNPMLEAFAGKGGYTILQINAHIGWRDSFDGERYGLSSTMRRASEMDHIDHIVQVGQRGLGSAWSQDYDDAQRWGAKFVSARNVHAQGIQSVLQHIPDEAEVIVCLDCDALDPSIMPGVIGRVVVLADRRSSRRRRLKSPNRCLPLSISRTEPSSAGAYRNTVIRNPSVFWLLNGRCPPARLIGDNALVIVGLTAYGIIN